MAAPQAARSLSKNFQSCNTTTVSGAPLLILFRFTEGANDFVNTLERHFDWHIDVIRAWANSWNRGDLDRSNPRRAPYPEALPVRTVIVMAPFHRSPPDRSYPKDEPHHITLQPSPDYWNHNWEGTYGGVHLYAEPSAEGRSGAEAYNGYSMGEFVTDRHGVEVRPQNYPWTNGTRPNQIRSCIRGQRAYRGTKRSGDTYSAGNGASRNQPGRGDPLLSSTKVPRQCTVGKFDALCVWQGFGPITVHGTAQYRVHEIVDAITFIDDDRRERLYYQVHWSGWPHREGCRDESWYPASNFRNCPAKVQEFHNYYPSKPGPPLRLQEWHKTYMLGEQPFNHRRDDEPAYIPRRTLPRPAADDDDDDDVDNGGAGSSSRAATLAGTRFALLGDDVEA